MSSSKRPIWWVTGYAVLGFVFCRYVLDITQSVSLIFALSFGSMGYVFAPRQKTAANPPADGPAPGN